MKKKLSILLVISLIPVLMPSVTNNVYGEDTTDSKEPKFIAIQHAESGLIAEINETAYSLELNDVYDKTILFSDMPNRIVTSLSTSDFIKNWSVGEDSYAIDPPNAAIVVDEQEGKQDVAIVELFNPVYNADTKTLKYEATPDNATMIELPEDFEQTTMIIDGGGNCNYRNPPTC